MDELIRTLIETGILAGLGLAGALVLRSGFRWRWLIAALLLNLVYQALLTRAFWTIPDPFPGADWNWAGKLAAFAGTLIVMSLPAFGWARCGARLDQGPHWRGALLMFMALSGLFFWLALSGADGKPDDLETIAFQWALPGLDEEFFYRGTLLLALNEAFRPRLNVIGAPIGYGGVLTSLLFGLTHALGYEAGAVDFDLMTFAMTGLPAFLLLWLRERTGSLVLPVIAHNIANGASTLL
ncbi:CAAX amino terminal protease family [Hyphomonas neptunium ATCC 15444]|uniref:CAAX amino terminal protease family n=2 Tax=Hyphomonas TaxID=85 RepID=Q0C4A5_HYPNA|nr:MULTISPECIES: CPBP family intramembrane glutamic endopeptidase [Hyphomonas]ABI76491.1 CAAX amino terminal protease family [Hyphomonas neptunium ATCC 15444]KCZ96349.1 CAAX amino protease [Hyphomonas hirschiana VP5]